MPPGGYHGHVLDVDLGSGGSRREPLDEAVLRAFVGGVGLGTYLLARAAPPGVEALAPAAPVVLALSPLVGTPLTTSAKFAVVAKSPLTDRINDALASDRFALELKACGIDALVVRGAAPRWSLLVVDDGVVRLERADDFVGLSAEETERRVLRRFGARYRFFGIGRAGEHLVRYATISGDRRHAGRGGHGAVFGSKRLKGILVRGTRRTSLADPARVLAIARDLSRRSLGEGTAKYRELGTVANVLVFNRLGTLPTRNFQTGSFEGAEAISGEALHRLQGSMRRHCVACTIGCEHIFETSKGKRVRLEYEGLFALGSLCGISDREVVLEAAARCDELGLDVISAGAAVAFAMECGARGLLDGVPAFGDGAGLLDLLEKVAHREDVGDLLAEGTRRAAATIGRGAERFAPHVKGLELPGYEPRALPTLAVGLAVGTRGADHNKSGAYEEDFRPGGRRLAADPEKGAAAARSESKAALLDSLILCKFLRGALHDLEAEAAEMLAAVTGWDVSAGELAQVEDRVVTARKLFNVREGWTRAEDTLPDRFLEERRTDEDAGGAALSRSRLDRMIATYYRARGWTEDGQVPAALARRLGLQWKIAGAAPTAAPSEDAPR